MIDSYREKEPVLALSSLPVWGRVGLALTVPVLERQDIQVCSLPTALLSAHGAYPRIVTQSQTAFLEKTLTHLESLNLSFSALYTGFIAEKAQFSLIEKIIQKKMCHRSLIVVDPILGDHGKIYSFFDHQSVSLMQTLASHADLITPNVTEAALLLERDPHEHPQDEHDLRNWLKELAHIGPGQGPRFVVLTSFCADQGKRLGTAVYDKATQKFDLFYRQKLKNYPGAGDYLTSEILAGLLKSPGLETKLFFKAVRRAENLVFKAIWRSLQTGQDPLRGLHQLF